MEIVPGGAFSSVIEKVKVSPSQWGQRGPIPGSWGRYAPGFAGTTAWVLPNPSGLNRSFTLDDLVRAYTELRCALEQSGPGPATSATTGAGAAARQRRRAGRERGPQPRRRRSARPRAAFRGLGPRVRGQPEGAPMGGHQQPGPGGVEILVGPHRFLRIHVGCPTTRGCRRRPAQGHAERPVVEADLLEALGVPCVPAEVDPTGVGPMVAPGGPQGVVTVGEAARKDGRSGG